MQIKALKIFCDVVCRRSFSRAAEDNGVTQSAASQAVQHLEERLGVKLIDRSRRPLVLTPAGRLYYEGCRKIVQEYLALEDRTRNGVNEVAGVVRVAAIYSVGFSHMKRLVERFGVESPRAQVRIQYEHPRRVHELVESDQVDLGLVSYPRSTRTIQARRWREEPMVVVCGPFDPLAARGAIQLERLDGLAMVGFDHDLPIRRAIDRVFGSRGLHVEYAAEFDNIETVKRAIEAGTGPGLLPEPTVRREVAAGTLVALPLADEKLVRPLGIICRRGKVLGKTAQRFMELLDAAARPEPSDHSGRELSTVG
ncbi:MAG TPA: LysR family transcriptional regulator [Planctomycetaceae bacterium]|nr:LysR family transcriptional regulator [Planctomycetaceae bacterium]HIQ20157.1 LysR family transcriptional regulator [Planctomycetota bacterium]